ncbi:Uu.00g081650.m01.CDS01 [Anthostomella pinea]|uniref:Uu.00g081650.m01.CDS01 n=1 Tax=Anthostomella pinea TaxID=933095 RepID=A0AAI8VL92_9PEZI|nr:Uu.00g081650.m01.CDS01 [Anthostomella pinea]
MASSEPFPSLNTGADQMHSAAANGNARRRRKSSGLGAEIRAGDTGAPSLQTSLASLQSASSSSSGSPPRSSSTDIKDPQKRGFKRRKARSLLRRYKHFALKHTWVIPLVLLAIFGALYAINPTESNPIHHFIFLSYELPLVAGADPTTPPQYGKGLWDVAFVSFYIIVLSFTREFIMQELLRPLARKAGIRSRGKQARFMEQMYTAVYFGVLGPAGMYVMSRTPVWYFNTRGMYENFPHKTHEAVFKFYYLFQAAYWAQQAIVLLLGVEARRKDFKELVGHHIVSLALIGLSYRFHFTYMGLAVYITHDISDFFLATSKSLNYIDHFLVGPYFGVFMCAWIYLRHYLNLCIIWSLFTEFKTVGPYGVNWETQQYKCDLSFYITLGLLASLQALNLFWLFFIVRIAYRFVVYQTADDDRSEAEDTEVEEPEVIKVIKEKVSEMQPLLNGHKSTNVATNGSLKERANGPVTTPKKKKMSTR